MTGSQEQVGTGSRDSRTRGPEGAHLVQEGASIPLDFTHEIKNLSGFQICCGLGTHDPQHPFLSSQLTELRLADSFWKRLH